MMMQAALKALTQGQVIALPTETVFGLAADPDHPEAVARLIQMKARPSDKGFILLIKDRQQLDNLILPPSPLAVALMNRFWPGPLSLVLPACPSVATVLTGQSGHIAVRISSAPQVQSLLDLWPRPLISTSANRAGQPTPCTALAIRHLWHHENLLVLEGNIKPDALPSTLVQVDGDQATLLRAGAIAIPLLEQVILQQGFFKRLYLDSGGLAGQK